MGAVVATFKDLKRTDEAFGGKVSQKEDDEIKEIIETQRVLDDVIVAEVSNGSSETIISEKTEVKRWNVLQIPWTKFSFSHI